MCLRINRNSKVTKEYIEHFDINFLYQEVLADIRFSKNQQWLVTTYVFGIYAGLVTIFGKLNLQPTWCMISPGFQFNILVTLLFALIIGFVIYFGGKIIDQYSSEISRSRKIKVRIINKLQELEKLLTDGEIFEKKKIEEESINKDLIDTVLKTVIILGGVIVIGYIKVKLFF